MTRLIHTPEGVRDIFGQECDKKRYLQHQIDKVLRGFGYQSIETPSFEFLEVFGKEVGTTPIKSLYKFVDREGELLALRPDFTPSIARAASMYFQEENYPLRLCYAGSVYANQSGYRGRLTENTQMGVELLNDDSIQADAEMIAMTAAVMKRAGMEDFQVSIGEASLFSSLAEESGLSEEEIYELRSLLNIKNEFGAMEFLEKCDLPEKMVKAFIGISNLFGNHEVLEQAKSLTDNAVARKALNRLERIHEILKVYGCDKYVSYDLGMLSKYDYYTGIIFKAYTYGSGDAVVKGGRYDDLLSHFGKAAPAVGFSVDVDAILNAIERQKLTLPVVDIKIMVLYSETAENTAISEASRLRDAEEDVACIRFSEECTLEDYMEYGRRNQFCKIIYYKSENDAETILLA